MQFDKHTVKLLGDDALTVKLAELAARERQATLDFLLHLIEFDSRRLYRELGYPSLYDYCRRCLKYSESSAYRRISAARCMKEKPELCGMYLRGDVTLCNIATAKKCLQENRTTPAELIGKTKLEVKQMVARELPGKTASREVIRPVALKAPALPMFSTEPEERIEIKFTLSKADFERFQEVKSRLSNKLGKDLSVQALVNHLVKNELAPKKARVVATRSEKPGRYIPQAVRAEVKERDQHQCSYVSTDGVHCTERNYLQLDHIVPFAIGGKNTADNLRLRCQAHNQLHAEACFGRHSIPKIVMR